MPNAQYTLKENMSQNFAFGLFGQMSVFHVCHMLPPMHHSHYPILCHIGRFVIFWHRHITLIFACITFSLLKSSYCFKDCNPHFILGKLSVVPTHTDPVGTNFVPWLDTSSHSSRAVHSQMNGWTAIASFQLVGINQWSLSS